MTIVLVSHPRNRLELPWCIESYRRHCRHGFDLVVLTERANLDVMRSILPGERVEAMAEEAETIPIGYYRQQAAKLYSFRSVEEEQLVITDDDTEAIASWSESVFFDECGRARIFYTQGRPNFWSEGSRRCLIHSAPRQYQHLLPFAIRRESLAALAKSYIARRALELWRVPVKVSEFELMGEWCWNEPDREERSVFCGNLRDHWTANIGVRPVFRDWQAFRRSFRKRIATAPEMEQGRRTETSGAPDLPRSRSDRAAGVS